MFDAKLLFVENLNAWAWIVCSLPIRGKNKGWSLVYLLYWHPWPGSKFDWAQFWTLITPLKEPSPLITNRKWVGCGWSQRIKPYWPWLSSMNRSTSWSLDRLQFYSLTAWSHLISVAGVSTASILVTTPWKKKLVLRSSQVGKKLMIKQPSKFRLWILAHM